jgi:hypothetical protein
MAQAGFTPIQLYSTSTAAAAPVAGNLTNSTLGSELAINITDGKLFYKDNANAVQVIGWKTVPTTAGGTGLTTYTAGDLSYYASGTTFTKLAIGTNGQILTSTGSAPQWSTLSGVAVTTFSAGTTGFTPNSATSGAVTLAGTLGVANGGTGLTSIPANGQLDIGNGTGFTRATLTAGSGVSITNASGSITIANNTGPAFSVYQTSATSLSDNTYTKVTFDTEEFDTNSNFSSSRFTPTVGGYYQINATVGVPGLTTETVVALYKNGSLYKYLNDYICDGLFMINGSALVSLNGSTDYIEIYAYQSSGTSKNTTTGINATTFSGAMVRGL